MDDTAVCDTTLRVRACFVDQAKSLNNAKIYQIDLVLQICLGVISGTVCRVTIFGFAKTNSGRFRWDERSTRTRSPEPVIFLLTLDITLTKLFFRQVQEVWTMFPFCANKH